MRTDGTKFDRRQPRLFWRLRASPSEFPSARETIWCHIMLFVCALSGARWISPQFNPSQWKRKVTARLPEREAAGRRSEAEFYYWKTQPILILKSWEPSSSVALRLPSLSLFVYYLLKLFLFFFFLNPAFLPFSKTSWQTRAQAGPDKNSI